MRIGSILLLAIGVVSAAACTANTSADLACGSADGVCLAIPDGGGPAPNCGEQLPQPCDPGFVCCTGANVAPPSTVTTTSDGGTVTTGPADTGTGG